MYYRKPHHGAGSYLHKLKTDTCKLDWRAQFVSCILLHSILGIFSKISAQNRSHKSSKKTQVWFFFWSQSESEQHFSFLNRINRILTRSRFSFRLKHNFSPKSFSPLKNCLHWKEKITTVFVNYVNKDNFCSWGFLYPERVCYLPIVNI